MQTFRIAAISALLLFSQVLCRPQNADEGDDEFVGDEGNEYTDDTDDEPEPGRGTSVAPPVIHTRPLHLNVAPGSTVEFPCDVSNEDNSVIQWLKGTQSLYFGGTATTQDTDRILLAANNSLIVKNVTILDSYDRWTCEVLVQPPLKIHHSLRVENQPNRPDQLKHNRPLQVWPGKKVVVNESMSVRFGCESSSHPRPEIKWSFKGKTIDEVQGARRDGNYVFIDRATRHHAGVYQCLAEDRSASPQHESIEVVVNYAPFIEIEHDIFHAGLGMSSEINCEVDAHPRAHVKWLKDGNIVQVSKDDKDTKKIHKHEKSGKSLHTLIFEHTRKEDLGAYICKATNDMGEATKEITLTGAPAKPVLNHGEDRHNQKGHMVRWRVQSFSPISEYKLEYRMKESDRWIDVKPQVKDGQENNFFVEYHFENLQPGVYEVRLQARNDFGWSPQSSIHEFRKEIIANEPQNVKGPKSGSSTTRPLAALTALLLVVSTRVFTCL